MVYLSVCLPTKTPMSFSAKRVFSRSVPVLCWYLRLFLQCRALHMPCSTFLGFSLAKWVLCSDPEEPISSWLLVALCATALWGELPFLVWNLPGTALWHNSHHLREAVSSVVISFATLGLRTLLYPEHSPSNAVRILSLSKCAVGRVQCMLLMLSPSDHDNYCCLSSWLWFPIPFVQWFLN